MSSSFLAGGFEGAFQALGRLLWLSHGLVVIAVIATFQVTHRPLEAEPSAFVRPRIDTDGIAAAVANRSGPAQDVRPLGYIVCTQREAREARSEIPPWTFGYIAMRGVTPQEHIDRIEAMAAAGEIQLIAYEC